MTISFGWSLVRLLLLYDKAGLLISHPSSHRHHHRLSQAFVGHLSDQLFISHQFSRVESAYSSPITFTMNNDMDGSQAKQNERGKEQEANRQRLRQLAQQREANQGGVLKHKPATKPPVRTAQQQRQHQQRQIAQPSPNDLARQQQAQFRQQQQEIEQYGGIRGPGGQIITGTAFMRGMRVWTASSGPKPVFNEKIWKENRADRPDIERSISPKTRVEKVKKEEGGGKRGNRKQDGIGANKKKAA